VRKHREELASNAFHDLVRAITKSAFAIEPREQVGAWALGADAKARLVTYGDSSLASKLRTPGAGTFDSS
jgi:hypothetical protein